jgi:hypothetical protein
LEQRATLFVEAMVVVAIVGVLAFLIGLIARAPRGQKAAVNAGGRSEQSPRWYEFTLALVLLAVIAAFAIWLISSGTHWVWGEAIGDWRSDARTIIFGVVMVALAVVGLVVSLAYALVQSSQQGPASRRTMEATQVEATPVIGPPRASPMRVLGLLAVAAAVVLLCWIALPAAAQFALVGDLIYPASLGVSLVLLFDKATRTWGKSGAESLREWLLCDLLVFLLILSFLNVRSVAKPEAFTASFWDILNVVLFFAAFWLIDRSAGRSRFLAGYAYLIVLPVLLMIWQTVQGVAAAASWWASTWPFLILAAAFFIFEVVTLISSSEERQTLPAIKDALFVIAYAVLLIVSVKSA